MDRDLLPTFFVIGAAKCGTQSLHRYLDEHPEISMSKVKEPCVFSHSRFLDKYDDYSGQFEPGTLHRGESTTGYTRYPVEGDSAPAIHAAVPDAKLIYLVRDPLERIVSDWVHHSTAGWEPRSLNEALADFTSEANYYATTSRYAFQLDRYIERFDREAVLVLEQEDLRRNRTATLREIFRFLAVEPGFESPSFRVEVDRRDDNVAPDGAIATLRSSWVGRAFRRLPARQRLPISRAIRRLSGSVPNPSFDPGLESELRAFLEPEYERVRAMATGRLAVSRD